MTTLSVFKVVLFFLMMSSCSKQEGHSDEKEEKPLSPVTVSELVTDPVSRKAYITVNGVPFPILGAQIRLDALVNCDKLNISEIEAYFAKAKELGVNCVQLPFWWNLIEAEENSYDFTFVTEMLSLADQYGLKVEVLWFGSNMIGDSFSYLVPQYVLSNLDVRLSRNDDGSFWSYYGYQYSLKLDHPWLLEREARAVGKLFDFIRKWDEEHGGRHPVISAQIHNEPDGLVRWRMDQKQVKHRNGTLLTKDEAWTMTLKALDEIGKAVKRSSYHVVTRVNLISGNGTEPYAEAPNAKAGDVFNLTGIDIISFDPYKESVREIKDEVLAYKGLNGNYPLIAENKGSYPNTPTLMLATVALGGGYDLYDLATSKFFIDNTTPDYVDQIDHGIYTWDLQYKPHTATTQRLLTGFSYAAEQVATAATADFAVFNVQENHPKQSLTQVISTTGATFRFKTDDGALAFALDCGTSLLLYATEIAEIEVKNGVVNSVEMGRFVKGADFEEERELPTQNVITLEPGKLYRLGFHSNGDLQSTVLNQIGM